MKIERRWGERFMPRRVNDWWTYVVPISDNVKDSNGNRWNAWIIVLWFNSIRYENYLLYLKTQDFRNGARIEWKKDYKSVRTKHCSGEIFKLEAFGPNVCLDTTQQWMRRRALCRICVFIPGCRRKTNWTDVLSEEKQKLTDFTLSLTVRKKACGGSGPQNAVEISVMNMIPNVLV